MALGIRFHHGGLAIDFSQPGIGLDQVFYESLFRYFKKLESSSPLKAIVALGYDDELFMNNHQIIDMLKHLEHMTANGEFNHPQVGRFCEFLREALSRECGIVVFGDMYPDLSASR